MADLAHLLLLESLPTIAGGQAVLVQLARGWQGRFRQSALLPGPGPLAQALTAHGVTCTFADQGDYTLLRKTGRDMLRYGLRLPTLAAATARLIRRTQVDLVYANSARTFVWAALGATWARTPVIWHHHGLLADATTLRLVNGAARLPAVRRILCASAAAQAQFAGTPEKTVLIPNGIDTDSFAPDPAARHAMRQALGIAPTQFVVGMVGDLIPLKGQDVLLGALQSSPELADMVCLLVGAARPGEAESELYAQRLTTLAAPNTQFLGRRSDIGALLNAFDLLVVASSRETGPLVLLEALACGTPVISTPVGIAPDLLPPDALVPVGDVAALRHALHRAAQQRRTAPEDVAALGAAGRAQVVNAFSLVRFQARVLAEIQPFLP
jgi:glycosyltransferase involved in cell wall biosynthesis